MIIVLKSWLFLVFFGMVIGVFWVCYFWVFKFGEVFCVVFIDKFSVVLVVVFGVVFFGEWFLFLNWFGIGCIGVGVFLVVYKG